MPIRRFTIRIQGHGADKSVGTNISLQFNNVAPEGGTVTLEKAYVDESANAIGADAPEAQYGVKTATITHGGFSITDQSGFFNVEGTVPYGNSYTFTAKDNNYNYTFTATMGGQSVNVTDNENGTFTITGVTGPLVINATRTAKTFNVTVSDEGNAKEDVQLPENQVPTYKTNYVFHLEREEYFGYTVEAKIGENTITLIANDNGTEYTIPGEVITGDITIYADKQQDTFTVTFTGDTSDISGNSTVAANDDYTFTLNKAIGYNYTLSVTMGDTALSDDKIVAGENNTYVINDVTGNLVIKVTKALAVEVTVDKYVKIDNSNIWLVIAKGATKDGDVLAYDGEPMYWSDKYEGYAYLVIADALTNENIKEEITHITAAKVAIDYNGDVNMTGVIDINDAQLAYDIYKTKYNDFSQVSMEKFLRADVNDTIGLDMNDSVAIVSKIN